MSSLERSIALTDNKRIERMNIPEKDKIDVVCRTLQNVSKEFPPHLIIREAVQNELDSILMSPNSDEGQHEIFVDPFHNGDGSVLFAGTGIGFTEKVVNDNFNSMFNSFKVGEFELQKDFDQCKGIGIKAASYGRSDLEYKTRNSENSFQFKFTMDNQGYPGLEKFTNLDEDGDEIEESITYIDDSDFHFLKDGQTGTELVVRSENQNVSRTLASEIFSIFGSAGKSLNRDYAWTFIRLLNMRYWSFPDNICVKVRKGPQDDSGTRVLGTHHYLDDKCLDRGLEQYTIEMANRTMSFNLQWFIMEEGMNNHFAIYSPFFAIKHKQELYGNLGTGHSRSSMLRSCGLSRAADRVVFIVEFEDYDISVPNSRKNITIDGHDVDLSIICEAISERLPDKVQKFKDDIIKSLKPDELVMKSLKSFLRENYCIKKAPSLHIASSNPPEPQSTGGSPKGIGLGNGQRANDSETTQGNKNGNGNNPSKKGSKNPKSRTKAKTQVRKNELPKFVEDPNLPSDIWANMNVKQWELTYNPNFEDIERMRDYNTLKDFSSCEATRKNVVVGALLGKSVEWIYNQVDKNIKEQDHKIQSILSEEELTKQAWLSSGAIARQKKSESSK